MHFSAKKAARNPILRSYQLPVKYCICTNLGYSRPTLEDSL